MPSGSLIAAVDNTNTQFQSLKERIELLLLARGEGTLDVSWVQAEIDSAVQSAIDLVLAEIEALQAAELSARINSNKKITDLMSEYGDRKFFFEFFKPGFTFAEDVDIALTLSVSAGATLIDVANTTTLTAGEEYLLEGGGNNEIITISTIVSATRIQVSTGIAYGYNITAKVKKTAFTRPTLSDATADDGQTYYSGDINLGDEESEKVIYVRRDDGDAVFSLYFKDSLHTSWTALDYYATETSIGISGFEDMIYTFPAAGDFQLKGIVQHGVSGEDMIIKHIVGVNDPSVVSDVTMKKTSVLAFHYAANMAL